MTPEKWSTTSATAMMQWAVAIPRARRVLAACACVRLVIHHVAETELRPLRAIEAAEAWARLSSSSSELDRDEAAAGAVIAVAAASSAIADAATNVGYAIAYAAYYAVNAVATDFESNYTNAAVGSAINAAYYVANTVTDDADAPVNAARDMEKRCAQVVRSILLCPFHEDCIQYPELGAECVKFYSKSSISASSLRHGNRIGAER